MEREKTKLVNVSGLLSSDPQAAATCI